MKHLAKKNIRDVVFLTVVAVVAGCFLVLAELGVAGVATGVGVAGVAGIAGDEGLELWDETSESEARFLRVWNNTGNDTGNTEVLDDSCCYYFCSLPQQS
jgi:hypothetical protein